VRGKKEIERELYQAEARIETLQALLDSAQTDREELKTQVARLQDALVSAKAPEAYRDHQIEKEEANRTPMSEEQLERNRLAKETTETFIGNLEKSLTVDDLDAFLARGLIQSSKGPASLHGNDES
jgi:peptidoglycan hydrolase CwlO-like protein